MFILDKYPAIRNKWFELKNEGKLTQELIDAIWTSENNPEFYENKEHVLLVMEKLNIIAKPRIYIEGSDELKVENYFLAPCMLRQKTPVEVICPEPNDQMGSSSVLCYVFKGNFMPSPIFHRLLAACVAHWPVATKEKEDKQENQIFCGCCVFQLDQYHKLTIHFREHVICVRVTRMGIREKTPSSKLCIEVREFITTNLLKIIGYLGQSLKFEYCIQCPEYTDENVKALISVSHLKENAEVYCNFHNNVIESCRLLNFWFKDQDQPRDGDVSPSTSKAEEREHFSRISCLLVDIGTKVLRRLLTFYAVTPNCTFAQFMNNNEKAIRGLRKNKILSSPQLEEIFPKQGTTDQRKYDISLTSALLLNLVPNLDPQVDQAIRDVRSDRNTYQAHTSSARMKSSDFTTHWTRITGNLIYLSKCCYDPDFEDEMIEEIKGIETSGQQDLQSRINKCEQNIQILYSRGDHSDGQI